MKRVIAKIKNKRGSEVVQTLIIVAIMGSLAITMLYALNNQIVKKANQADVDVISSQSTDVDHVISQLEQK